MSQTATDDGNANRDGSVVDSGVKAGSDSDRADSNRFGPSMSGGIVTGSNIGGIGGEYGTPIINYPEVAILALGAIKEKPRVVDGDIVPRKVLTLSLSFDHRIVDGAVGARFTNKVKEYLMNPNSSYSNNGRRRCNYVD